MDDLLSLFPLLIIRWMDLLSGMFGKSSSSFHPGLPADQGARLMKSTQPRSQ